MTQTYLSLPCKICYCIESEAIEMIETFIQTPFEGGRHQTKGRKNKQIEIENKHIYKYRRTRGHRKLYEILKLRSRGFCS